VPPVFFAVDYAINPWMDPDHPVNADLAVRQWESLRDVYRSLGHRVDEIVAVPGLPDMVFAANGATVIDGKALGAQFKHPQRADEAPAYRAWLDRAGYEVQVAKSVHEGEGDFLFSERYLLAGTGFRTEVTAHAEAQEYFGRPAISLQLVDPRYYHLDTALLVLDEETVAYFPGAFSLVLRSSLDG
jgi:N-dimethylarginine dimethylaminohydrolase